MFDHLDIYAPADRWKVGLADAGLTVLTAPFKRRRLKSGPRRILLLRLERIGDLLMSLGAIRAVRAQAPDAAIDLVVGSWNEPIARLIDEVTSIETLDAPWLARGAGGSRSQSLVRRALAWRSRHYDLAINFEGDIRSHALLSLASARRRVGFAHAGGGPLLTDVVPWDGGAHVADNSLALVERAFDVSAGTMARARTTAGAAMWRLNTPESARAAARAMLSQLGAGDVPLLAVHAPGGREVKQWPVEHFADAAAALAGDLGATALLTGAPGDDTIVGRMEALLKARAVPVVRVQGNTNLVVLAAILRHCHLLLTGDTGPMHVAAAVGTPIVAVFGPSMPWRYAPLLPDHRVVRVDLPCSPCNRIRLPPERCQGHTPDCLVHVDVEMVVAAGRSLLASLRFRPAMEAR